MARAPVAAAIDVHAHWFPQAFLDLLGSEGPAHGLEWRDTPQGPQFGLQGVMTGPAGPRSFREQQKPPELAWSGGGRGDPGAPRSRPRP